MQRLCVFCGSSYGARPAYLDAARELGAALAHAGITTVYGGASVGLMGAVADAALAAGGEVIGVIPRALQEREIAHSSLTRLEVVGTMHERKARMAELSDGFIALPGGTGTLEEFFEIWTWAQLGTHRKPCGLLNIAEYYTPLLDFLDHAVAEGFARAVYRQMVLVAKTPADMLTQFATYDSPAPVKWVKPSET